MKFSNWTIGRKLWTLSLALMANMALVGLVEYRNMGNLILAVEDLADVELPAVRDMGKIDMYHDGIRSLVYRALIASASPESTEKQEIQDEFNEMSKLLNENLDEMAKLGLSDDIHKQTQRSATQVLEYVAFAKEVIGHISSGRANLALKALPRFEESFKSLEKELGALGEMVAKNAGKSKSKAEEDASKARMISHAILIFGLLFGVLGSYFSIRDLVSSLTGAARQLSAEAEALQRASGVIGTASEKLSEAATEQSAAIEETVSSMEEISSMLSQTAQQSQNSLKLSEEGQKESEDGKQVVARMGVAMDAIQDSNSKLEGIVSLIEEIRNKTKVINDIVFETRLLSFNASIEAARAGVHGKGFAVVAEEVGKLASMSGKAADEIGTLLDSSTQDVARVVKDTQERVSAGKEVSQECESAFNTMSNALVKISESVKMIANATKEQEVGVRQTNQAMSEMDQVTQRNSRGADELAFQANRLGGGAKTMTHAIQALERMVFGSEFKHETGSVAERPAAPEGNSSAGNQPVAKMIEVASTETPRKPETRKPSRGDSRWKSAA